MLLTEEKARKEIEALPVGPEPRIKWAGFDLPGEIAEGNFLTVGDVGMGKTSMHCELFHSIIPSIRAGSNLRALVFDVKRDLLSKLPASEIIIFNPLDKRSAAWDIAADISNPAQALAFAEGLILQNNTEGNEFFTKSASHIVAAVINSLNRTHQKNWDLRRLILLTTDRRKLESVLLDTNLNAPYFSSPVTFANIQSTIAARMVEIETIAALWQHAKLKISLREWLKAADSILVLSKHIALQAPLHRINNLALQTISTALLSGPESPHQNRFWFFCDDLRGAGRLDSLPALLHARFKGARCVLGFQDVEGLNQTYGNAEIANEILSRCANVSWLKLASIKTADWASNRCGDVLLPSEFLNLPTFAFGKAHGVHMIKGLSGVFKGNVHCQFSKSDVIDFDPRPEFEHLLKPWGPEDDKWLTADE